ncbi:MAG: dihydropteroate synthase [Cardiobacteriaceae bacterium]|nr:dihydropteroate synthase [Cardiobacteriaceae bacterium]
MQCGRFQLDLNRPKIMGILNLTPDSFSDGGKFIEPRNALIHAEKMLKDGADILDIGAESTRPGSESISVEEEISRLKPVVSELLKQSLPISIDTKNTRTMEAMLDLGVDMINDVRALEDDGAVDLVAKYDCAVCLMHMRGMPINMQMDTNYGNLLAEVSGYLQERARICLEAGIDKKRICLDYGFGFGKTPEQNFELVRQTRVFVELGYPILLGVSRKSSIGHFLGGAPVQERITASAVVAAFGAYFGAKIIRAHDVRETKDALLMCEQFMK